MSILSKSSSLIGDVFQVIYGFVFLIAISLGAIYTTNSLYAVIAVCVALLIISTSSTLKDILSVILPKYMPKVGYIFIAGTYILYAFIETAGLRFNDFIF